MIMSVHEPLSRKRALGSDSVLEVKRHCPDIDHPEAFSDTMYLVLVKSALENLEKVCQSFPSFKFMTNSRMIQCKSKHSLPISTCPFLIRTP